MFSNNWFEVTAKANFAKYVAPFKTSDTGTKFLEIGCYEGQATLWMLEHTDADITVIDTFEGSREHGDESSMFERFEENIKPYVERVRANIGASQQQLKVLAIAEKTYDFIYIDGSHEAKDVLEDAVLAFPLLKSGGTMIFDDYTWRGSENQYELPAMGIDAFLHVYADQLEVLEKNSQVIIKKK